MSIKSTGLSVRPDGMADPSSEPPIRILMVYSHPEAAGQIRTLLSAVPQRTFLIDSLETLRQARAFLATNKTDVILAGLALEDAQGLDIFTALHKIAPRIPIFLVGENRDDALALRAVGAGAHDYLVRSTFNSTMLTRVLSYAIERKKFESHIYIAEEKYRMVFEKTAVAITVTDGQKRILSWNHQAEILLGMSHDDLYLKPVSSLYPAAEWEKIRGYQDKGHSVHDYLETQIIRRDGVLLDVGLSISMIRDPDGRLTGSIGILQNISERKRVERLKDEFISTVSHELRTPLTIIRESVSQVLDRILGEINPDQEMVMGLALEGIDRLTRIVNDLLDMSKLEAGKVELRYERLNMTEVVESVSRGFSAKAKAQGVKILTVAAPCIECPADRDKIIQVLTNLISNALKFTEQGEIRIQIEDRPAEVAVSIQDTGRGIAEQDLGKLFQKFQQLGRVPGPGERGTGLGLAISKSILDLHHAKLGVESQVGRGSRFFFNLPKKQLK